MSSTDYPNDSQALGIYDTPEDAEQKKRGTKEHVAIAQSLPVIEDTIAWFNEQIEAVDSTANIDLASKLSAESQILAYQKLSKLLVGKRDEFLSKFNSYIEQRKEAGDEARTN